MTIETMQQAIRKKTLALRSIDRILHSDKFKEAFSLTVDHSVLVQALDACDSNAVSKWVDDTIKSSLHVGEMSLRELRKKAATMGIVRYNLLTKEQLLREIAQTTEIADVSPQAIQNAPLGLPAHILEAARFARIDGLD